MERAVPEASLVLHPQLVDGVLEVHLEALLHGPGHLVDGVLEVGRDAQADEVGDVPQRRVGAIGAAELAAEAHLRLDAARYEMDLDATLGEQGPELGLQPLASGAERRAVAPEL